MIDAAGTGWTEDRVERLAKLWGEGLSASQIAAVLGGGVTRNAVIGKVHRLGLSGRAKPGQAASQRPTKPRSTAPAPAAATAAGSSPRRNEAETRPSGPTLERWSDPLETEGSERVALVDLRDSMCRWPIGDPTRADFGFCGGRSVTSLPYCAHHCRIAYQPAAERKRLRA